MLRARTNRPFTSVDDLALRVPELRKDEINRLAEIGALNGLNELHRRAALWQAQRAMRPVGPFLEHMLFEIQNQRIGTIWRIRRRGPRMQRRRAQLREVE